MMKGVLRVAALFAAYSVVGVGGEYAFGLFAEESEQPQVVQVVVDEPEVEVERHIVVEVKPTIVSRVQVRHSGECTFELDRELTIPASVSTGLHISAGSGALHVEGEEGLEEIVVVGMLCASHEEYLDDLQITVNESSSGTVLLETHYPERRDRHGDDKAKIDLTVLVPFGMDVEIDDTSGEIEATGTGDLSIDDSSGSIFVHDIVGSLSIDDGSGGIAVEGIGGNVDIEDGSGGIEVVDVMGSVALRDGSGGIEIERVDRDVRIGSDGSGGIDVRGVGGDFIVDRDGSGGIRHSGVEGRVEVPVRRRRGGE